MERPEVIDPLKEEEQPPVEKQTDDAFSVREQAEKRLGKVGTGALDFVPIVGDVLAAGDVADSYRRGDTLGTAVNLAALGVGVVPIIGDLAAKGIKKGFNTYRQASKIDNELLDKGMEDIADADVAPTFDMRRFADDFKNEQNDIDLKLSKDEISPEEWKIKSKENNEIYKKNSGINISDIDPVLEQSAVKFYKDIEAGVPYEAARADHLKNIEARKPIREWDNLPNASSEVQQVLAVDAGKRKRGFFTEVSKKTADKLSKKLGHPIQRIKIPKGAEIFGRLDVDAYTDYNAWVSTIGVKGDKAGKAAGKRIYGDAVHYVAPEGGKVSFDVSERTASQIAKGEMRKTPFAVIRGLYEPTSPAQIRKKVKALLKDPEWTQVGFDPRRLTAFYTRNKAENQPVGSLVESADEVFQIGPLILAKNVKRLEEQRLNKGGAIRTYKEGGVVPMQEQMNFAFMNEGGVLADDGVDRDPVSGNEVPAGSMAEEVRDDVPAMLSEGEYVVPADVVRYHGIDKFEQLRDEAKMGLARMEADGRIGGQPVEEQEEFPFPVEELEGFQEGGVVGDIYPDVMGQPFTPGQRYPSSDRFPGVGFELRNFTNPTTGKTVVIPFFNGNPMQYIPPDFLEGGASTTRGGTFDPAADERDRQEREAELARGTGRGMSDLAYDAARNAIQGVETGPKTKPFSEYSADDFRNYLAQRKSGLGRVMDAIPVVGLLTSMQDNAAREFARKSLIQGKNIVTGEALTNNEAGVLMEVADMPRGKSILETIDDFLQGKTPRSDGIVIDDTVPIDTELRRTTYEPQERIDTQQDVSKLYGDRGFTPETIGEDPQQQYYGPPGEFQNIIESAKGTVAEEAKKIVEKGDDYDAEKVDRESAERMRKAIGILKNPAQTIRELLGAKPLEAQEMTDSTAKQIAAYNQAENTILKEEVSMADSQGNSLGNTTDEILGNIEKSSNINYNESTKLFEPYQVRKADGTLEPFWTIGVGQRLTQNLPVDANGVITSAPPAGQTKEQVVNNFKKNVRTAFDGAKRVMEEDYGAVWGNLSAGGMSVTTQVAFQNGIKYKDPTTGKFKGLFEFKKANEALAKGDIATAQKEYLDSKWAKSDSPPRARLVVGDLAPNSTVNTIWKRTTAVAKPVEDAPLPDALLQQETGFDPTVSQPLQQTFIPPSVPTRDEILRAGGIDAYVESLPQDVEQKAQGLQDLPVGVSIEADGQFTGTGGLGAVQAPRVRTPIVKRDFLDPSMSMSRREVLSDPTRFRGPSGAGIGPMSEDARLQTGLATDFNRFTERADRTPFTAPRTADDKPITTQTEAMLGDIGVSSTLPTRGGTIGSPDFQNIIPPTRPQQRRLGLSPGAMGGRQFGMSPGAMGGRAAPPAPTPDFLEFEQDRTISAPPKREAPKKTPPKEEQISQREYEQRVADATRRENEKARDRADSARDEVLRQGGSVQEAFDAAQTAFTGFTPSGEMVDPFSNPVNVNGRLEYRNRGGLASKPKKSKPKKRNTKKGLGGRMAT